MSVISPDPTLDSIPLYPDETEDVILARWQAWANEGLDPVADADLWVDTREGGHWQTACIGGVRECARIYDLMGTDVVMSAMVVWSWGTYLDDLAAQYDVERLPATQSTGIETFTGPAGVVIPDGFTVAVAPRTEDDPAPTFFTVGEYTIPDAGAGTGSVDVPIEATDPGRDGDVAANAITAPSTPVPAGVTFTNAASTGGGSDPETDDALRLRVLQAISGKGPGTVADYVRWAMAWPSVGSVKVVPVPFGPLSVLVSVGDPEGQPLPSAVTAALQADLDPVPGQGAGTAPIGAQVTVDTFTTLTADISAHLTFETGYSWNGFGGTIAVSGAVEDALSEYLLAVPPGGEIVLAHIAGIFATADGVHDVSSVLIGGVAANVPVGLTPPQSAVLGTVTMT